MTLGSLVGFRSSKIGPRIIAMHVVSHPQASPTDIYRGFTIVELLSDLVQSQFPQSDGKVLHRSGQNGTGRKRSNAHAESCQKTSENHNECQLVSHSKSSEVDFTPFPDCGQTMTVIPNQVRFCEAKLSSMEIDIA